MKELKFEELSLSQKLGMTMCAFFISGNEENNNYIIELIKKRSLGALWVNRSDAGDAFIKRVRELSDYPILIICDAENGFGDYKVGRHNSIGIAGSEELAYLFGKAVAVSARAVGYNVVCNPVVDIAFGNCECGMNSRCLGDNKVAVAKYAEAEIRGMHDGGILSVCKHYPGQSSKEPSEDSHMAETCVTDTKEELLDNNLYPYKHLMDRGLLDGIMTTHCRFTSIDDEYPASLSKKVIGLIRDLGFNGFAITDALSMMGVVAKYGWEDSKGLAVAAGNDLALVWSDSEKSYKAICESYEKGIITDEILDAAVKRIIASQNKTMAEPKYTSLTEEEKQNFERLNTDTVFAKTDEGLSSAISKDGKHFFVVLAAMDAEINDEGKVTVDPMDRKWYNPGKIIEKLEKEFPNSAFFAIRQYPTPAENMKVLERNLGYDDVVFISTIPSSAYIGKECFTSRIIALIRSLQVTSRVSTIVHFGNPYPLEDLAHIPRILIGTVSSKSIDAAINVLAGNYPAKGVLTYDVKLK